MATNADADTRKRTTSCGGNSNWCGHYENQCSSLSILLLVCVVIVHNDGLHKDIFVRVYHVF